MNKTIQQRVAELSATLLPISDYKGASYITSPMVELAEDCNSYNASFFCNGEWIKPVFEGDFKGCLLQSVGEFQVLRFYFICTRLEGIAWDKIPEDWDAEDAPDFPEMEVIDTIEFRQLWFNQDEQITINLNDFKDYGDTYVVGYHSLQDWAFEPKWQDFIRNEIKEYSFERDEQDCTLDVIFSSCVEMLNRNSKPFCRYLYSSSNMRQAIKFTSSYKVALRHGFQLPTNEHDAQIYVDYLTLLDWAGRDTRNPKFICNPNFIADHDRMNNHRTALMAKREQAEAKRLEEEFAELHSWLFGIEFDTDQFHFQSLDSVEAYRVEGEIMHHCIFRCKFYNKHDMLAMHITDHEGNRVATCTVNLTRRDIDQIQPMCDDTGFFKTYGIRWQETNDYKHIWNTLMARMHTFPTRKPHQTEQQQIKVA